MVLFVLLERMDTSGFALSMTMSKFEPYTHKKRHHCRCLFLVAERIGLRLFIKKALALENQISPRLLTPPLLNKIFKRLQTKTTFRGCFGLARLSVRALYAQKKTPLRVSFFSGGAYRTRTYAAF